MSSTNRGNDRHASDYYVTPQDEIKKFLLELEKDIRVRLPNTYWLDPCAGGDRVHAMSYFVAIKEMYPGAEIETIEIRNDSRARILGDYLKIKIEPELYDIIITNPSFYLAQEIIKKALSDVRTDGYVIMLLRLNFFGSEKRFPFWKFQMPVWCYVHRKRMSFTDDGKTDSIEYMHAIWQKGHHPDFTMLRVI